MVRIRVPSVVIKFVFGGYQSSGITEHFRLLPPVQGWEQWTRDIEDIVSLCESEAAIELVQDRNRALLTAISRERQDLYQQLGESFGARLEALRKRPASTPKKSRPRKPRVLESEHG